RCAAEVDSRSRATRSRSARPTLRPAACSCCTRTRAKRAGGDVSGRLSFLRAFAKAELLHLELQALARNLEKSRRVRDVAVRLLEGAAHELALETAHRHLHVLLETALGREGCIEIRTLGRRWGREKRS